MLLTLHVYVITEKSPDQEYMYIYKKEQKQKLCIATLKMQERSQKRTTGNFSFELHIKYTMI